jgi:hypothetical protein
MLAYASGMRRALRFLLSVVAGFAIFSTVRYWFPNLHSWVSVVIGILASVFAFIGAALDFTKKSLEGVKLWEEIRKLRREAKKDKQTEEEAARHVKLATRAEIQEFGESILERAIKAHLRLEQQKDRLTPTGFVTDVREERKGDH